MSIESLRRTVQEYKKGDFQQEVARSEQNPVNRREIRSGIKRIHNDTGEFIELLNESLGTASFDIENPNFDESNLPQAIIDFFVSQYELMPKDVTFGIRAVQSMNKNLDVYLESKRRGQRVSQISYCTYVRPKGAMSAHVWTNLYYDVMQPMATVEAEKAIKGLLYTGDKLVDDTTHLQISEAIFEFAVNETEKHIQSQVHEPTEFAV